MHAQRRHRGVGRFHCTTLLRGASHCRAGATQLAALTAGDGPEALLPGCVPDLQLDPLAVQEDLLDLEVDAGVRVRVRVRVRVCVCVCARVLVACCVNGSRQGGWGCDDTASRERGARTCAACALRSCSDGSGPHHATKCVACSTALKVCAPPSHVLHASAAACASVRAHSNNPCCCSPYCCDEAGRERVFREPQQQAALAHTWGSGSSGSSGQRQGGLWRPRCVRQHDMTHHPLAALHPHAPLSPINSSLIR
jgi:hypothetical protein